MQATTHGGLSGKARFNRHRNRAYRMHAQQMLEEYYDEEAGEAPERPIPLRGRSEFLPTIDRWTQEDETFDAGEQLQLTLVAEVDEPSEPVPVPSAPAPAAKSVAEEIEEYNEQVTEAAAVTAKPVKVIPAPYWARPRASFQPQGGRPAKPSFDLLRFGFGCALGSAAAAAILFVVSVVVH